MWSIDSGQNRVSTNQYHMAISQAQESTHQGYVFFEVLRWQVTSFQLIAGSTPILFNLGEKWLWEYFGKYLATIQLDFKE